VSPKGLAGPVKPSEHTDEIFCGPTWGEFDGLSTVLRIRRSPCRVLTVLSRKEWEPH